MLAASGRDSESWTLKQMLHCVVDMSKRNTAFFEQFNNFEWMVEVLKLLCHPFHNVRVRALPAQACGWQDRQYGFDWLGLKSSARSKCTHYTECIYVGPSRGVCLPRPTQARCCACAQRRCMLQWQACR